MSHFPRGDSRPTKICRHPSPISACRLPRRPQPAHSRKIAHSHECAANLSITFRAGSPPAEGQANRCESPNDHGGSPSVRSSGDYRHARLIMTQHFSEMVSGKSGLGHNAFSRSQQLAMRKADAFWSGCPPPLPFITGTKSFRRMRRLRAVPIARSAMGGLWRRYGQSVSSTQFPAAIGQASASALAACLRDLTLLSVDPKAIGPHCVRWFWENTNGPLTFPA